jgi:hypothetical protein
LAHEQSWEDSNYSVQNTQGSRGTIAFGEDRSIFVGVVYSPESERCLSDTTLDRANENNKFLLQGIPDKLKRLCDEALDYLLQDIKGVPAPLVTAAFWSDLETPQVTSCEAWSDVLEHGGRVFDKQFRLPETALDLWATDHMLDEGETRVTRDLFDRRITTIGAMNLTDAEIGFLHQRSLKDEGLEACRRALSEIDVILP